MKLDGIELGREQVRQIVLKEIEYQLTIMKQYLSEEDTQTFFQLLLIYGNLMDRECIMAKYKSSWGDTYDNEDKPRKYIG